VILKTINLDNGLINTLALNEGERFSNYHLSIGILAGLLLCIICIIIALLQRIKSLKSLQLNFSTHTPSDITENLYSDCPTHKKSLTSDTLKSFSDISSVDKTDSSLYSDSGDSRIMQRSDPTITASSKSEQISSDKHFEFSQHTSSEESSCKG